MTKNQTVKTAQPGKPSRSLSYEPNLGEEIYDGTSLDQVDRKVHDEVTGELVIYLSPSPNPYP